MLFCILTLHEYVWFISSWHGWPRKWLDEFSQLGKKHKDTFNRLYRVYSSRSQAKQLLYINLRRWAISTCKSTISIPWLYVPETFIVLIALDWRFQWTSRCGFKPGELENQIFQSIPHTIIEGVGEAVSEYAGLCWVCSYNWEASGDRWQTALRRECWLPRVMCCCWGCGSSQVCVEAGLHGGRGGL